MFPQQLRIVRSFFSSFLAVSFAFFQNGRSDAPQFSKASLMLGRYRSCSVMRRWYAGARGGGNRLRIIVRVTATRRAILLTAATLYALLPLAARADSQTIEARDSYFATKYIVVTVGDTITWVNAGSTKHTVTSEPGAPEAFDSSPKSSPQNDGTQCQGTVLVEDDCLQSGDHFSFTFPKVGTYNYYCKAHGDPSQRPDPSLGAQAQPCGMCAQVVVQAKPSSPPPPKLRSPSPRATKSSASPSPSPSASPTESGFVIPTTNGTAVAAPGSGGGGGGGRTTLAVLILLALSGAAYATWRKFLAPR
jgi:plastocyanin